MYAPPVTNEKETYEILSENVYLVRSTFLADRTNRNGDVLSLTIYDQIKDIEYYEEYRQHMFGTLNIRDVAQTLSDCIHNSMKKKSVQDSRMSLSIVEDSNGCCFLTVGDGQILPTFIVKSIKLSKMNRTASSPLPYIRNKAVNNLTRKFCKMNVSHSHETIKTKNGNISGIVSNEEKDEEKSFMLLPTMRTQSYNKVGSKIEGGQNQKLVDEIDVSAIANRFRRQIQKGTEISNKKKIKNGKTNKKVGNRQKSSTDPNIISLLSFIPIVQPLKTGEGNVIEHSSYYAMKICCIDDDEEVLPLQQATSLAKYIF